MYYSSSHSSFLYCFHSHGKKMGMMLGFFQMKIGFSLVQSELVWVQLRIFQPYLGFFPLIFGVSHFNYRVSTSKIRFGLPLLESFYEYHSIFGFKLRFLPKIKGLRSQHWFLDNVLFFLFFFKTSTEVFSHVEGFPPQNRSQYLDLSSSHLSMRFSNFNKSFPTFRIPFTSDWGFSHQLEFPDLKIR